MIKLCVLQVDKNAELAAKWKYCALSQERLKRPIVACELGRYADKSSDVCLDKEIIHSNKKIYS